MNIAIMGLGVVGKGVYELVKNNHPEFNIKYILELDEEKKVGISTPCANSWQEIIEDEEIDAIVELIGGIPLAYQIIKSALIAKKHVVTANKAVISKYYEELMTLADENNVFLRYEAAVGGGIIVLSPLDIFAKTSKVQDIQGIINGSTNFVLSKMFMDDFDLKDALKLAFELGFLESGNNEDIEGLDLMRKMIILSSISYHHFFKENDCSINALNHLTKEYIDYLKGKDLIMKLIGKSFRKGQEIMLHIDPVIFDKNHLYNQVNYEQNIIEFKGDNMKNLSFMGPGAGRYPTAASVLFDLFQIRLSVKLEYEFKGDSFTVNNDLVKYRYLLETKNKEFIKTPYVTKTELKEYLNGVVFYARIDESIQSIDIGKE